MPFLAFLVNCPDAETADRIETTLLERHLVAATNRFPPIRARYHWEGRIREAEEYPLLLKTRPELRDVVEAEIARLHPYAVPPIVRLPLEANVTYLAWLGSETSGTGAD